CLLTTAITGVPASDIPRADVPKVIDSLARTLRLLHTVPTDQCPFDRRLRVTLPIVDDVVRRAAVNIANLAPQHRSTPPTELLTNLRSELDRVAPMEDADLVVCHGDACLPNFIVDPETLECVGVVDLGRLGIADRYLDLSLTAATIGSD